MGVANSISRLTTYYTRHGFGATIRRAGVAVKRALFSGRMVVFYCDLAKQSAAPVNIPSSLKFERVESYAELSAQDLQEMTSFWNAKASTAKYHGTIRKRGLAVADQVRRQAGWLRLDFAGTHHRAVLLPAWAR